MLSRLLLVASLLLCVPLQGDLYPEQSNFQLLLEEAEAQGAVEARSLQDFIAERDLRLMAPEEDVEFTDKAMEFLPYIPEDYFLPDDHPAKPFLDRVFAKPNIIASVDDLRKAGFINPVERKLRGIVVGFHPDLEGYLVKIYLDSRPANELDKWIKRIEGARLIQATLDKYGYNDIMKVPQKWLYRLPENPKAKAPAAKKKQYILVVENMDIYSDADTWKNYKTMVQTRHLNALYNVLVDCKLIDSTWIMNIPFAYDGRIAFVDTEFAGKSLMIWNRLPNLAKYLSPKMADYWMNLIDRDGIPPKKELKDAMEELEVFEDESAPWL